LRSLIFQTAGDRPFAAQGLKQGFGMGASGRLRLGELQEFPGELRSVAPFGKPPRQGHGGFR
jgi:hypothetical protein